MSADWLSDKDARNLRGMKTLYRCGHCRVMNEKLGNCTHCGSTLFASSGELVAGSYDDPTYNDVDTALRAKHLDDTPGYHIKQFDRGAYGESSKILEEVQELQDAEAQGARVMALHELADIIGAVDGYRAKHFPDISFDDIVKMFHITKRVFESGRRR